MLRMSLTGGAKREQFSHLCDWLLKKLTRAKASAELEATAEDFQKLKMHYVRTVGYLTLSDRIEQQKEILTRLQRQCSQLEEQLRTLQEKLGMPIERALTVISELASTKSQFGLSAEQVKLVGRFVAEMTRRGWSPETLCWYVSRHFQTLLDLDSLEGEKRRLEGEIEKLAERKNELYKEISCLRRVKERIAEEAHALKVVRDSLLKTLNEEMEILGKAEINSMMAGDMYKAGADALVTAIQNDSRFLAILMTSALNENLAKQTETFTQIVKENAEKIKQEATNLSAIAELLQNQAKA